MDYQEKQVAGKQWTRCGGIRIANPADGVPHITFIEQEAIALDGGRVSVTPKIGGDVTVAFDPATEIDLYDPVTGEPTGGKATHGQVYAMLYSAYLTAAHERDAAAARRQAEEEARQKEEAARLAAAVTAKPQGGA